MGSDGMRSRGVYRRRVAADKTEAGLRVTGGVCSAGVSLGLRPSLPDAAELRVR